MASEKRDARATSSTKRRSGRRTVIRSQQFAHVPLWLVSVTLSRPSGFHAGSSSRVPEPPQLNPTSGTRTHAAKVRGLNTNRCTANTSFGWEAARSTDPTAVTILASRNRDTCSCNRLASSKAGCRHVDRRATQSNDWDVYPQPDRCSPTMRSERSRRRGSVRNHRDRAGLQKTRTFVRCHRTQQPRSHRARTCPWRTHP